jgi:hypothetical protein
LNAAVAAAKHGIIKLSAHIVFINLQKKVEEMNKRMQQLMLFSILLLLLTSQTLK